MAFRRAISVFRMAAASPASRFTSDGVSKTAWNTTPNPLLGISNQTQIWTSQFSAGSSGGKISIGPETESAVSKKNHDTVYFGPISSTIKKVKLLSLSTCCLSISLGPVITFMTSPDMNVILKGAVASTVIFLSASTTGALHWFVSPYVHRLKWCPGSDSVEVEMMTWMATSAWKTVRFADVEQPRTQRPFVTFRAGGEFYFVDGEHFKDKKLLARLTPPKNASFPSALKNL